MRCHGNPQIISLQSLTVHYNKYGGVQMASLIIMAAGLGSRYGSLKQVEPVGPSGELLLEYNLYNAIKAGFSKAVFVLNPDLADDFISLHGAKIAKHIKTAYSTQNAHRLPVMFAAQKNRVKPWGTGHAVYCAAEHITEPFCVINADDYYGRDAFEKVFHFINSVSNTKPYACCMAGFRIENTLTAHGCVSRGICETNTNGMLVSIHEVRKIRRCVNGIMDVGNDAIIPEGTTVSMNMWGFPGSAVNELEKQFCTLLSSINDPLTGEIYLPDLVNAMLLNNEATVHVIDTESQWHGVTYKDDLITLQTAIAAMIREGQYPDPLL
jgi:dTDP-glucose pyrophosphorylase